MDKSISDRIDAIEKMLIENQKSVYEWKLLQKLRLLRERKGAHK